MRNNRYIVLTAVLALTAVQAKEVVLTEKPIDIKMPIGKEMIIKFPEAVTHTNVLNSESAQNLSTLLSPQGILYMTATAEFPTTRMVAELVDGRLVMFDIAASQTGPFDDSSTTVIERPAAVDAHTESEKIPQKSAGNPNKPDFLKDGGQMTLNTVKGTNAGDYHTMVQAAFKQFYGPTRLAGPPPGTPVSVKKHSLSIRMNNGRLQTKVLRSYQIADNRYLTVLLVNNLSHAPQQWDPRAIRGRWIFAASLHPVIGPSGSASDRTLWALISQVPFDKAF